MDSDGARLYGMQALILRLQKEWMEKLPITPKNCNTGIAAFRRLVRNALFHALFFKCDPSKREEMLEWIGKCLTEEELFRELLVYTFEYDYPSQIEHFRQEINGQKVKIADLERTLVEQQKEVGRLKEALGVKQGEVVDLREEMNRIYTSWTYRIGHAATWLPRKMRDGVRQLKEKI